MGRPELIPDTSILLYLGRIQKIELLTELFSQVHVPQAVALELDAGRLLRADTPDPRRIGWLQLMTTGEVNWGTVLPGPLGAGEAAVIAGAQARPGAWAGLDDAQARRAARQLGLPVVGTVGILIQAKRDQLIDRLLPWLTAVEQAGLRVSDELHAEALRLAGE